MVDKSKSGTKKVVCIFSVSEEVQEKDEDSIRKYFEEEAGWMDQSGFCLEKATVIDIGGRDNG